MDRKYASMILIVSCYQQKNDLSSSHGQKDLSLFEGAETGVLAISTEMAEQLPHLQADTIIQFAPPKNIE